MPRLRRDSNPRRAACEAAPHQSSRSNRFWPVVNGFAHASALGGREPPKLMGPFLSGDRWPQPAGGTIRGSFKLGGTSNPARLRIVVSLQVWREAPAPAGIRSSIRPRSPWPGNRSSTSTPPASSAQSYASQFARSRSAASHKRCRSSFSLCTEHEIATAYAPTLHRGPEHTSQQPSRRRGMIKIHVGRPPAIHPRADLEGSPEKRPRWQNVAGKKRPGMAFAAKRNRVNPAKAA
jgi:hypothetical protein